MHKTGNVQLRSISTPSWLKSAANNRFFLPVLIVLATFTLYADGHWGELNNPDEFDVLGQALEFTSFEILFNPEKYQTLSSANFTPWVTISVQLDNFLFGFWLPGYWAHNLISIAIALVLFFTLLRRLSVPRHGAAAATLFLMSTPVVEEWAAGLQLRHYIEGFIFGVISLLLAIAWLSRSRKSIHSVDWAFLKWMAPSAIFFLLACLSKEIYAIIPLLILFAPLPELSLRAIAQRILYTSPVFLALALYLFWRQIMLSGFGGYEPAATENGSISAGFDISVVTFWLEDLFRRAEIVTSHIAPHLHLGFGTQTGAIALAVLAVVSMPVLVRRLEFPILVAGVVISFSALLLIMLAVAVSLFGIAPRWITIPVIALIAYVAWSYAKMGAAPSVLASTALVLLTLINVALVPPKIDPIFRGVTMAAYEFARNSEPNDLLYVPDSSSLITRHVEAVSVKAELFQGQEAGIASTGPLVNHLLNLSGLNCHVLGGERMYRRATTHRCIGRKAVLEMSALESDEAIRQWMDTISVSAAQELSIRPTGEQNLHVVIFHGNRYVHVNAQFANRVMITRPQMRRSHVDPATALVSFAIEEDERYLATFPRSLRSLADLFATDRALQSAFCRSGFDNREPVSLDLLDT